MTPDDFKQHRIDFIVEMIGEMDAKNEDYKAGSTNQLHYEEIAENIGCAPMQVWATLFCKHVHAIFRYCRDGHVDSEDIQHRLKDAANYCLLGSALVKDLEDKP